MDKLDIQEGAVQLLERAVRRDGTMPVKVIQSGWGSSGYYPPKTLKESFSVFEGAQMFWNHPKTSDSKERPERDLRDLAAVLSNVHYKESGPNGEGIYGDATVFSQYREAVSELAPHIGLSILASGEGQIGEAEGKKGLIVEAITKARSVDFVTQAGAGGKILQLFEAARSQDDGANDSTEEVNDAMDIKEALEAIAAKDSALVESATQLAESQAKVTELTGQVEAANGELARFREGAIIAEAIAHTTKALEGATVPDMTKVRITESTTKNPPVTAEGVLDVAVLDKAIEEAVKIEADYIAKLTESGRVKGMGSTESSDSTDTPDLTSAFQFLGLSESAAKSAAAGRA